MALFLLLSDIHAADKPPSSCTDSYCQDILDLLVQTVRIARERGVAAVIWAGDIFNIKIPWRTSHWLVQQLVRICVAYGVPLYIVPGNHDIANDRLESLDRQPLGTLLSPGPAILLNGWAVTCGSPSYEFPLYGVPWQQSWDHESIDAVLAGYCDREMDGDPALVVTHAPLYPRGRELPYEYYQANDWASSMGDKGFCFYGHVHEPHGVYTERGVTFCNNGALSRGSIHEYNLDRIPAVTIWDSTTGAFEAIPLDAKPASEVFRLTERQEVADAHMKLDEYLEHIQTTTLGVVSTEQVLEVIRSKKLGPELEALVQELLEEAGQ